MRNIQPATQPGRKTTPPTAGDTAVAQFYGLVSSEVKKSCHTCSGLEYEICLYANVESCLFERDTFRNDIINEIFCYDW